MSHTFTGNEEVGLNGQAVPEAGFNAAIAGEFNVPVVFLSGDQTIAGQAGKMFGPIETAAVKEAIGYYSAININPEESQRLIREGVKRGVERRKEISPFKLTHPVKLEITYKTTVVAEVASYLRGVERVRGNTIVFTAQDMVEASKFRAVISLIRP